MIGIIDVGGGLRGAYGAGVLDYCLRYHISFDALYGVSAGAANLISYAAGQRSRTFHFYTDYAFRPQYMGWQHYIKTRNYLNLDYIYDTLSAKGGEDPLDFPAVINSGKTLTIVATNADTAKPHYFTLKDLAQDQYEPLKASSCLPLINTPIGIDGSYYVDGGVSDPIPIQKALEDGCDQVVVILTRPLDTPRNPKDDEFAAKRLAKYHPVLANAVAARASVYNAQVDLLKSLRQTGKVLILSPQSIAGMKTLTKDREQIKHLYHMGQDDAIDIPRFLHLDLSYIEEETP